MMGLVGKLAGTSIGTAIAPYWKFIKWGLIISVLLMSHSCAYYKGRESVIEKAATAQVKQLEKDNKANVERAERVSGERVEKDKRVEQKLKELDDAIEQAKAMRDSSCRLSDDELRVLNELIREANSGVPSKRS
jgi:DNA-dependent RNA polymerase auxiliary subunit epsilon